MQGSLLNEHYFIQKPIVENQGLSLYTGYAQDDPDSHTVTIHCIHNKKLIKYYLTQMDILKAALPLEETFVKGNDLCLVFRSHEKGLPIHHHSFKVSEKKQSVLSLLAKLAVDKHLPNFIKWQLINLETLTVDHNKILHLNVQLDLMTPDNFNDFSTLQSRIAEMMMSVFKEDEWDVPLKQFLENCQTGAYLDSLDLLKDYKRLIGLKNDHDEPWFYAFLYDRYMDLKKNSKRLVAIVIVLMFLKYGYGYMQKSNAELVQPYVKTVIGLITYDDPYTEALEKEESITFESVAQDPPKIAPTLPEATPKAPVAVPPAYETHVVKPGEFLIQICKEYYGDGKYAWALAKFNELKNPSLLPVGFPLKLPPKNIIESIFEKL